MCWRRSVSEASMFFPVGISWDVVKVGTRVIWKISSCTCLAVGAGFLGETLVGGRQWGTDKVLSMWSGLLCSVVTDAKGGLAHRANVSFPRLCPVETATEASTYLRGGNFREKCPRICRQFHHHLHSPWLTEWSFCLKGKFFATWCHWNSCKFCLLFCLVCSVLWKVTNGYQRRHLLLLFRKCMDHLTKLLGDGIS